MGYGGALIWTGLARNLKRKYPEKRIVFIYSKKLSDYLRGKKIKDNVIYENNKDIFLVTDSLSWIAKNFFKSNKDVVVVDISKAAYCERVLKDKVVYRTGGHVIDLISHNHGIKDAVLETRLVLKPEEEKKADTVLTAAGLVEGKYICFEPNSKKDFTPNKEWPRENW
jgi:ADP-heptose:LPS heptosyltransferase